MGPRASWLLGSISRAVLNAANRAFRARRYAGHTQSCAQCRRALEHLRAARGALRAAAAALGAAALLAAAAAVCVAAGAGGVAGGGGPLSAAGAAMLSAAAWLTGVSLPTGSAGGGAAAAAAAAAAGAGPMLRALVFGCVSLLVWRVSEGVVGGLEEKLLRGSYPPPRNTDKSN